MIGDYHPGSRSSAAVDQGAAEGAPAFDLDGMPRPVDFPGLGRDGVRDGFDIGAYELQMGKFGFLLH